MKVGFIGAGKAGCSLGKYFATKADRQELEVTGYYSLKEEDAVWAAAFTESACFRTAEEVMAASDTIILSTPDGAVKHVWESCNKENGRGKIICHLSGSLSSDVFSGIEQYEAYPLSIHPMFAFSSREFVYQQLNEVSFTLEGHVQAVTVWRSLLTTLGNPVIEIEKDVKPKYHAAASLLSNHVVAVLSAGYELLCQCGFTEEQARSASSALVRDNVEHVICQGAAEALTGPVERADVETIQRHLSVLEDLQRGIYLSCGRELVRLAKQKNPDRDYEKTEDLF
ncbi:MAG: DUF2520 domain-containing protein [Lachnospiraceae bacterium]|nr:DUF2520 domain-containing protein [Lachnospiraceae bacterium]